MPQYWLWKEGILHSNGKIPVPCKREVQEDEVDQMHEEASLLKPHSGRLFYRMGQRARRLCSECTEKSQLWRLMGAGSYPPSTFLYYTTLVLYSVPCPGPNGLDL